MVWSAVSGNRGPGRAWQPGKNHGGENSPEALQNIDFPSHTVYSITPSFACQICNLIVTFMKPLFSFILRFSPAVRQKLFPCADKFSAKLLKIG